MPTMTWSLPTSSGLLTKAGFSKLRLPTLILYTSAPAFKVLLEHVMYQRCHCQRLPGRFFPFPEVITATRTAEFFLSSRAIHV